MTVFEPTVVKTMENDLNTIVGEPVCHNTVATSLLKTKRISSLGSMLISSTGTMTIPDLQKLLESNKRKRGTKYFSCTHCFEDIPQEKCVSFLWSAKKLVGFCASSKITINSRKIVEAVEKTLGLTVEWDEISDSKSPQDYTDSLLPCRDSFIPPWFKRTDSLDQVWALYWLKNYTCNKQASGWKPLSRLLTQEIREFGIWIIKTFPSIQKKCNSKTPLFMKKLKAEYAGLDTTSKESSFPIVVKNSSLLGKINKLGNTELVGLALGPFIFVGDKPTKRTVQHETIHYRQFVETGFIGFTFLYFYDFYKGKSQGMSDDEAYRNIRAEVEAYENETKKNYLQTRVRAGWI